MKTLYLMKCNEFYKIGYTGDIKLRHETLQTASPYNITIIDRAECKKTIWFEKALHSKYQLYAVRNEWFEFDNDILELIKKDFKLIKQGNIDFGFIKNQLVCEKLIYPIPLVKTFVDIPLSYYSII